MNYDRYCFFKEHAGGVGRRDANGRVAWEHARVALDLARAEEVLSRATEQGIARVEWRDDDYPYDCDGYTQDEIVEKFRSNEWSGPFACLVYVADEVAASLCGIVVGPKHTNDPYCRVVEAELASEIESELREALSDAADSARLDPGSDSRPDPLTHPEAWCE